MLTSGYFGDSFADWCVYISLARITINTSALSLQTYGASVDQITAPFGESVSADEIEAALKKKKYKLVTLTHVDTSTGVLSDPKLLSDIVKRVSPDTLVCSDI